MTSASTATGQRLAVEAASPQQIFFTHCRPEDSLTQQTGYSIRATSTRDAELLRFIIANFSYELPLDMSRGSVAPGTAPSRLARVMAPGGKIALVHTTHLPEDTRGRMNSFFSHVLVFSGLTPLQALMTWGSPEWTTTYSPGAPKDLGPLAGPPGQGRLGDQALTEFLSSNPRADQNLTTLTCPGRLLADVAKRRGLLRLVLNGCQRALQAGENDPRNRLYLAGEPGLIAMLLYGAVRLLPREMVGDLTFSTYENSHRSLKEYRLARVVGTYSSTPQGLNPDFYHSRGFAIDTFTMQSSTELQHDVSPAVEQLVELAAQGAYPQFESAYTIQGPDKANLAGFVESLRLLELNAKLAKGEANAAGLLELRRTPMGRSLLNRYPNEVWSVVRDEWMSSEPLRQEFAEVLAQHLPELVKAASRVLATDSLADWQRHWGLVKSLSKTPRSAFLQIIESAPPTVSVLKLPLLCEWNTLAQPGDKLPGPLSAYLASLRGDELGQLPRTGLPPQWQAVALFQALDRAETEEVAAKALREADEPIFSSLCQMLSQRTPAEQYLALLKLVPSGPSAPTLLPRLLASRSPLLPRRWSSWSTGWARLTNPGCPSGWRAAGSSICSGCRRQPRPTPSGSDFMRSSMRAWWPATQLRKSC